MEEFYDMGTRLQKLRTNKNLSLKQVAKKLNLSESIIYNYGKNTRTPSVDVLSRLALFYDVSTDYLLGHDKRRSIYIDFLTESQVEIINSLLIEFAKNNKYKGE